MNDNSSQEKTVPPSFGRIFEIGWKPELAESDTVRDHLLALAHSMQEEGGDLRDLSGAALAKEIERRNKLSDNDNVAAAYTYFGQFVSHDITFNTVSAVSPQGDATAMTNLRTPRLDMDSMYGGGPDVSPQLYGGEYRDMFRFSTREYEEYADLSFHVISENDEQKRTRQFPHIDTVTIADLERGWDDAAIIADTRNDQHMLLSQVHLAFQLAHNELVGRASTVAPEENAFELARKTLRWLYQYILWNDFLKRICDPDVHNHALQKDSTTGDGSAAIKLWKLGYPDVYTFKQKPFIPLEFSFAAYRLGHTMVRNVYETSAARREKNFLQVFGDLGHRIGDNLKGGRRITPLQAIQWDWFLDFDLLPDRFPQRARKFSPTLASTLFQLPGGNEMLDADVPAENLAFRDLWIGYRSGLPSGTAVAEMLGYKPITIEQKNDSLWYYILKEAQDQHQGDRLGKVGSTIVCATFAGLLTGDQDSYFTDAPNWLPHSDPLLQGIENGDGSIDLRSIIRLSGLSTTTIQVPDSLKLVRGGEEVESSSDVPDTTT